MPCYAHYSSLRCWQTGSRIPFFREENEASQEEENGWAWPGHRRRRQKLRKVPPELSIPAKTLPHPSWPCSHLSCHTPAGQGQMRSHIHARTQLASDPSVLSVCTPAGMCTAWPSVSEHFLLYVHDTLSCCLFLRGYYFFNPQSPRFSQKTWFWWLQLLCLFAKCPNCCCPSVLYTYPHFLLDRTFGCSTVTSIVTSLKMSKACHSSLSCALLLFWLQWKLHTILTLASVFCIL